MKCFKGIIFMIISGSIIISCKKENYVLYPVDKACDSIVIKQTYLNHYTFSSRYGSADARIIKDKDSIKVLELDLGPDKKLNKLIIKKNKYTIYPGLIDGNEFIVKRKGDPIKSISGSNWELLKSCHSKFERCRGFEFDRESQLFRFEGLVSRDYGFTYKTKDSVNYQLFMKIINRSAFDKYTYDPDFVSIELQLLASHMIKARFYGMKLKDRPEITYFNSDTSDPQTAYYYQY